MRRVSMINLKGMNYSPAAIGRERNGQIRGYLPSSRRAKQFAPFDALKGLKEAIAAKEMRPESSRELTEYMKERINNALLELQKGQQTTVVYYEKQEQQATQITGTVMKVDAHCQKLQVNQVIIDFLEIYEIHKA